MSVYALELSIVIDRVYIIHYIGLDVASSSGRFYGFVIDLLDSEISCYCYYYFSNMPYM